MRIRDVFKKRSSALNFREDFKMNEVDFDSIFELARYSPSVYNTQGIRYLCIQDKLSKEKLKDLNFGQHKISTASGIILILHTKDFLEDSNIEKIYRSSVKLGMMSEEELSMTKEQVGKMKDNLTKEELKEEMYRNTYINVGMLISVCTVLGFDTCPMHVHNVEEIRKQFNIPDDLCIMFMLAVGKAEDKKRIKGAKVNKNELVRYEKF